ncbi:MAG TPA: 16S rRNA (uracil(1498)-N(3))-methyltransferase [Candidatus Omnitrophota bacterium]|nr:16S rRNA (uracil(1498)-N(3))-methyltransferase [Candidatus Omnitrophota bacterium]
MAKKTQTRKLRRFFTQQKLQHTPHDLWLDPAETHHLKNIVRLRPGDSCLVTDGQGGEAEAVVGEFDAEGRACLQIRKILVRTGSFDDAVTLRVFPVMLRKGKTDLLVEKAQELGAHEFCPVTSEHCEVQIAEEKTGKIVERWNRIAREASKQSGNLKVLRIREPQEFKKALAALPPEELVVIFHPGPDALTFPAWLKRFAETKGAVKALNIFVGPEGGFSEDEIRWARWHRKEKNLHLVGLGEILFKADTAFIGILASIRFSNILVAS